MRQFFKSIKLLTLQARHYGRSPFPNEVSLYLHRAKLIDSIRLHLRSNSPTSLTSLLNTPSLDSFVVANAVRSAPNAQSALSLLDALKDIPHFKHSQTTLSALANVLAKSQRKDELARLISDIKDGKFTNACVSYMDCMRWHAAARDFESVRSIWEEYRASCKPKRVCTESYNIMMHLYVQKGEDLNAVKTFLKMIDEGVTPNSRTYTIIIEHLVNSGKLDCAMEVFELLPLMRIKHTLRQYSVLVEGFIGVERFDRVKGILNEMRIDGIFPGPGLRSYLQRMRGAGYVDETKDFLSEMSPDERIKNLGYCIDSSEEDEDEDEDSIDGSNDPSAVEIKLKPWLDPRALANALSEWGPGEIAALEDAELVWTTRLVCKLVRNFKSPETAWKFFSWVAHRPGYTHDVYTIQRMMALLARHGNIEVVDQLISKVKMERIRLPFNTIRLLIDFYGISKNADAALTVFRDSKMLCGPISKSHMMLLYSSLLRALTKCGRNSQSLDILDEMILCGNNPDIQTYTGLMHHFAVQGDIRTVQRLAGMVRQSNLQPDAFMYKVVIKAYCNCERAALALRAFKDMRSCGLLPDSATKILLVKSLWKEHKRAEAAEVEESCEEINDVLQLASSGHLWTVSSSDLTRVYTIYSNSFVPASGSGK